MQQSGKIAAYLETVGQQIRWKRAQPIVLEEIENHIVDQKNALLQEGLDEETATAKALTEMGDPVLVGEQLDHVHRPQPDWTLLTLTGAMLLLGFAIQFFIDSTFDGAWRFEQQMVWAGIAVIVMLAAYFADFTIIGKYPRIVFFTLGAITLVFCFFTGEVKGAVIYAIYPLLLFPAAFAGLVYSMRNKGYGGLILCGAAFIIPALLSMLVPSLTVLFLLAVSCLIILTAAVVKGWFNVRKRSALLIIYIPTIAVLSASFFITMMGAGYRAERLQVALNPSLDPQGMGYMGTTVHRILSHSQFIGGGMPVNGYGIPVDASNMLAARILPEINTDYLLTYLTYRFGWIALFGIIALFAAFIIRAAMLCQKQKSVLGFLTSTAIVATFSLQFIVYIASNLGFMLFSPLSLPLVSYGKIALVTNMFLIGLLLSVFRTGALASNKAERTAARLNPFIQYDNGRIIIDLIRPKSN
ncbi:MAG: FtsW/RodA/SpoVE family cell cycle protein [Syntrophomonadaceae bacterium]|nr:FtsW/RodA/SpoVE family cell cycle protein [Syntrophomonadaceae bacterium]